MFSNKEFSSDSYNSVEQILNLFGQTRKDVYLTLHGKIVNEYDNYVPGQPYRINFRLVGGKGGFGSMLRALGAQIEKTTNREACRDLSGRRIRDVNTEKKLREWAAKQEERDAEREKRKQEKRKKRQQEPQVSQFVDQEYTNQKQKIQENLEDALKQGFSDSAKEKKIDNKGYKKVAKSLMSYGVELSSSSEDDDESSGSAKKRKVDDNKGESSTDSNENNKEENLYGEGSSKHVNIDANGTNTNDTPNNKVEINTSNGTTNSDKIETETPPHNHETPEAQSTTSQATTQPPIDPCSVDLLGYTSVPQLESLGLDVLKELLKMRGVKCGGTLNERAERLMSIKDLNDDQIPVSLIAGKGKNKKK